MTTDSNQGHSPTTSPPPMAREGCAGCGATLLEDQRYCLQCGLRRGKPRLDFTAFWKSLSLTGAQAPAPWDLASQSQARGGPRAPGNAQARAGIAQGGPPTTSKSWLDGAPPRRAVGALAAAVLAAGIVAGAALGPSPTNSPADSSTLAERALAGLVASASGPQAAAPVPARTSAQSTPAPPTASAVPAKAKPAPPASEAGSPSQGSAPGESPSGTGSQGSSPEGPSKGSQESEKAPGTPVKLPPIKHVWVIALSGVSFSATSSQAQTDPYLAKQLVSKGTLLSNYTLTAPGALANGIALLSGQGVNLDTEQNCPTYSEVQPPTVSTSGLAEGVGCVYPAAVQTLADELTAAGLTWKAYVQGMESGQSSAAPATASATNAPATGAGSTAGAAPQSAGAPQSTPGTTPQPTGAPQPTPGATPQPAGAPQPTPGATPQSAGSMSCRHPTLGAPDPNQAPTPGDPYLTFRNPFVYFHSLLDGGACASDDVDLAHLQSDLATLPSTPSLSWIVPSACEDGSSTTCAPGSPSGLAPADRFLQEVVPQILATAAYREGGLIAIIPDSAPTSPNSAASPGSAAPTEAIAKPVGALLLSPFVRAGAHVGESLNDFSLLKSLSRLFGVLPLGHANDPSVVSFGATVYSSSGAAAKVASTAKKAAQAAPAAPPGG
jgi:hypothetical protein